MLKIKGKRLEKISIEIYVALCILIMFILLINSFRNNVIGKAFGLNTLGAQTSNNPLYILIIALVLFGVIGYFYFKNK